MATIQSPYQSGDLFGFYYLFENTGDGLRKHSHSAKAAHNIIVLSGQVVLSVTGEPNKTFKEGSVVDFDWAREHQFIALQPGTLVLNLMLFGMPEEYTELSDADFRGTFDINV